MIRINPVAALKIQRLLSGDEKLHWADMPNPKVIFHSDDWSAIPFSVLWTGFFVFWEWEALQQYRHSAGQGWFMVFWGIPFLAMGNYMVWGRFIVDAWLKRRTFYAVTSRRVLVLQERWHPKVSITYLESIPMIEQEGNSIGTIWLGPKLPLLGARRQKKRDVSRFSIGDVPVLADIDEVGSVHKLIDDLRLKSNLRPHSAPPLT